MLLAAGCNEPPSPAPLTASSVLGEQVVPGARGLLRGRESISPSVTQGPTSDARLPLPPPTFERLGYSRPSAQVLACGPLGFVRLTERGFEVYSYSTLRRTARYPDGVFTHVVNQPGYSYLLVGAGSSLLYYQANPRLTPLGHLHAIGPFVMWADQQDRKRIWVHYLKDDAVHHFALSRDTKQAAALLGSVALPNFAGTVLARLTAGQWLYAAHGEWTSDVEGAGPGCSGDSPVNCPLRLADGTRSAWVGATPPGIEAVVSGAGSKLWLVSSKRAQAFDLDPLDRLRPHGTADLAGEPWLAVSEGGRLAVLSQRVEAGRRRWTLQLEDGAHSGEPLELAVKDAGDVAAAARRGACLVPARPWVVVGGPSDLRVIDYATREELLSLD